MKKIISLFVLSTLLLATGCNAGTRGNESSAAEPGANISMPEPEIPLEEEPAVSKEESATTEEKPDPLKGLIKDEYDGLEITAAMLIRRAVLPGSVIPVTVVVTNSGDKVVSYVQGSGSSETPEALVVQFEGLQPVLPKDHLGPMTMDFVTKELKPGESIQFVMNVLAVKPSADFDKYTFDLYSEEQTYIADLEWPDLLERHPNLEAAEPGSYEGAVSFRYGMVTENGEGVLFGSNTGYAQAELTVSVNE